MFFVKIIVRLTVVKKGGEYDAEYDAECSVESVAKYYFKNISC